MQKLNLQADGPHRALVGTNAALDAFSLIHFAHIFDGKGPLRAGIRTHATADASGLVNCHCHFPFFLSKALVYQRSWLSAP